MSKGLTKIATDVIPDLIRDLAGFRSVVTDTKYSSTFTPARSCIGVQDDRVRLLLGLTAKRVIKIKARRRTPGFKTR